MKGAPDPDMVIAIAEQLKRARLSVKQLEAQWEKLFAQDSDTSDSEQDRVTLGGRIIDLLEYDFTKAYRVESVAEQLGAKHTSVASALSRLVREGRIEKRGQQGYGALNPLRGFGEPAVLTHPIEEEPAERATEVTP